MNKGKLYKRRGAPNRPGETLRLRESAAAAAFQLLRPHGSPAVDTAAPLPLASSGQGAAAPSPEWPSLEALKERCLAFGINISTPELIAAGLHLLTQQTETALEVAILQSLRADRTSVTRRTRR